MAVIQQRYYQETKHIYWAEIESWLTDTIYLHPKFKSYFDERSAESENGLYPTVTIRQVMWGIKNETITARAMGNLL